MDFIIENIQDRSTFEKKVNSTSIYDYKLEL